MNCHSVEKIGGTSMSNYRAVRDNIVLKPTRKNTNYQRIFVVSAYAGITDALLRLSVGLEATADLRSDVEAALAAT